MIPAHANCTPEPMVTVRAKRGLDLSIEISKASGKVDDDVFPVNVSKRPVGGELASSADHRVGGHQRLCDCSP